MLWRAARLQVWLGDVTSDPAGKRRFGSAAAELARRAIALQPARVEGHYYAALGVGIYCQGVGVLKILREGRDREFTAGARMSPRNTHPTPPSEGKRRWPKSST